MGGGGGLGGDGLGGGGLGGGGRVSGGGLGGGEGGGGGSVCTTRTARADRNCTVLKPVWSPKLQQQLWPTTPTTSVSAPLVAVPVALQAHVTVAALWRHHASDP